MTFKKDFQGTIQSWRDDLMALKMLLKFKADI